MPIPTDSVKISQLALATSPLATDELPGNNSGVTKKFNPAQLSTDYKSLAVTPTLTASNGQREYVLQFAGIDYTGILSQGMKLSGARTVARQTQSTNLNGTTQYWSKSAPAAFTFTDDFCIGGWVYLKSYPATAGYLITRNNGTSGFDFYIEANGQVTMVGRNAGLGNYRGITSNESFPTSRWIFVASQLDMSAFTLSSTTCYITFDGRDVPSFLIQAGTNPTALIQAGNLEIGGRNGGTGLVSAYIQDAFVTSGKLTQSQVRDIKDRKLTTAMATTYSMSAAYPFDGNGNDVSTNANNLTANGAVVATDTNTAFSNSLWCVATSTPTYTGGNTSVTVFCPEGAGIPNETLGSFSYSSVSSPYGFPAQARKWTVQSMLATVNSTTPGSNVWSNIASFQLSVPSGSWRIGYSTSIQASVSSANDISTTLGTSSSAETNKILSASGTISLSSGTPGALGVPVYRVDSIETTTMTPYYHLVKSLNGGTIYVRGDNAAGMIFAELAYS